MILFLATSCRKEKFEAEGLAFVGKWKWSYSSKKNASCEIDYYYTILNPDSIDTNFYIEFLENGKVIFTQNQNEIERKKIRWEMSEITGTKYFYELHFDKMLKMDGIINADTLIENRYFPFLDTDCEDYTNFFIKE
ncbi:MAG: hypothetical protein ABJG68_07625 [Crocinitomicaceae bacterium]